jgi:hypothetical protein
VPRNRDVDYRYGVGEVAKRGKMQLPGALVISATAFLFALTACSSESAQEDQEPTEDAHGDVADSAPASDEPTSACGQAFARVAQVGEMQDTVEDLYGPAKECTDLDDWSAGAAANPGAIDSGVDPVVFAYNMCTSAPDDVAASTVCSEAISADPLGLEAIR